jgi:hypothetical protein
MYMGKWPSEPDEAGNVPALMEVMNADPELLPHIKLLLDELTAFENKDGLKFQLVVDSRFGKVCLPAANKDQDDNLSVYYSHAGPWAEDHVYDLLRWVMLVRATGILEKVPIIVLHDQPVPDAVSEVVSCEPLSLMCALTIPYLTGQHAVHASLVTDILPHAFGVNIPGVNEQGLQALDQWRKSSISSVDNDSIWQGYLIRIFGSFVGEVIRSEVGGTWEQVEGANVPGGEALKVGDVYVNVYGRTARWLREGNEHSLLGYFQSMKDQLQ